MTLIPAHMIPVVDAFLRGIDPRVPEEDRLDALSTAMAEPIFVMGMVSQILMDYHARAERLGALDAGHFVDDMRRRFLGMQAEDTLGYALNTAQAGERVETRLTDPPQPVPFQRRPEAPDLTPRPLYPVPVAAPQARRGSGPNGEWTVADAAREAGELSRRRIEAEITGIGQGGSYPGAPRVASSPPAEAAPVRADAHVPPDPNRPPQLQRLLEDLQAKRLDEAAVEGDLDDPMQARAAIAGAMALDPEEPEEAALPVQPPEGSNDLGGAVCGAMTSKGPCRLMAGHLVLPVPGTEDGHVA